MPNPKIDLFLDSGAFSAFTQGVTIDLKKYIAFIKEHESHLTVYANLDVIGDPEGTWRNQQEMEAAGLHPLPCYHYGENPRWLHRYLNSGHDYVALGGMAADKSGMALTNEKRSAWLDTIFGEHLCGSDGLPRVKVHGFGLTSLRLMLRYPWYSVDSTSWVMTGRMGSVFVPRRRGGMWLYGEDSWKVCVSSRSPNKSEAGAHIDTFFPLQRKEILEYFELKGYSLGESEFVKVPTDYELAEEGVERWMGKKGSGEVERIKEPGLCNTYQLRDELNIIYFLDLEKSMPEWPWSFLKVGGKGMGL